MSLGERLGVYAAFGTGEGHFGTNLTYFFFSCKRWPVKNFSNFFSTQFFLFADIPRLCWLTCFQKSSYSLSAQRLEISDGVF